MITKKVLFLSPIGGLGGAERSLLRLLTVLGKQAPEIERQLLVGSEGPLVAAAEGLGVAVERLSIPPRLHQFGESRLLGVENARTSLGLACAAPAIAISAAAAIASLRQQIRWLKPDLVHSNGMKTHVLSALACPSGIPLVWHLRDFVGRRPLMSRLLRVLQDRARIAIANSEAVAVDARKELVRLPVKTMYNAIDTDHFSPGIGCDLDAAAGLPAAPYGTLRVGMIATFAMWKGHDVFLRAVAEVCREVNMRAYIVGGPIYATAGSQWSLRELKLMVQELGIEECVGFIPFQQDTALIYRSLDVVVHASTSAEPFGLTIVEAMACGRAVIVSAAGGAAELFTEEYDAIGHAPGSVKSMSHAIIRLLRDATLRNRLELNARKSAVDRFHQDRLCAELLQLYASL